MIIVSQDKKRIVNFDNLAQIYTTHCEENNIGCFIRYETVDSLYNDLGEYETEERAKEVLEEIIEKYENIKTLNYTRETLATRDNFIYRMPKE